MAFLADDPNKTQQDPNNPQANQVAGQGVTIGGGANTNGVLGGGAGTVGANSSSGASPKGTSSGSFTNLQNYVTANQGNDAQMGQQVQGMVQGAAGQADQAGQQFQKNANTVIGGQTVNEDPNLVSSLKSGDTSNVDKDSFAKQYGAKYQGPTDATGFDNYANTAQAYKNVDTYGQEAAGDTAAKGQLLQDTYGKGGNQYNQGDRTLDSFVLGAGQQGAQALSNINQQYGNYSAQNFGAPQQPTPSQTAPSTAPDPNTIYGKINGWIGNAQTTDQRTAQDVQGAAQTGFNTLQGRLDDAAGQVGTKNTAAQEQYKALTDPTAAGHAAALRAAGLTDAGLQYLNSHNANFGQYVTGPKNYGLGDIANKNDVTNYQNLVSLVNGAAPGTLTGKYQATDFVPQGGADASFNKADVDAANQLADLNSSLNSTLASRQTAADSDFTNMRNELQGLSSHGLTQLSPAQLDDMASKLGVTSQQLSQFRYSGLDPTKYLTNNRPTTQADVATSDQATQFSNLAHLLGLSGLSGSANGTTPGYKFDAGGMQTALYAAQQKATNNVAAEQPGIDAANQAVSAANANNAARVKQINDRLVQVPQAQYDALHGAGAYAKMKNQMYIDNGLDPATGMTLSSEGR